MKINWLIVHFTFLIAILVCGCQENKSKLAIHFPKTDLTQAPIIPKPSKISATNTAFALDKNTMIQTSDKASGFKEVAAFLSEKIAEQINLDIPVQTTNSKAVSIIYINQSNHPDFETNESYELDISNDVIILSAKTAEGAFRGVQTLRQIIPNKSNDALSTHKLWLVPTGKIIDSPNFEYRGAMLDVARHFFGVADIKKYIDLMAYYKLNVLHLHLSDDQGWRIEIKARPNLTLVSGNTQVGGGKGGFYSQEEYKAIIVYALKHHITIIPEIDMPGHTNAASVAYPYLNGTSRAPKTYKGTRVGFSTFDTHKETTYTFIDDVIKEIAAITPGPYFHIGGDESHATKKKDYIYFIDRVEKIVHKYDKQMIGWDEIMQTNVDATTIAQHWSSPTNAISGAKKGSRIILSPANKAYLDMQYDSLSKYGLHWASYIPVDVAYNWSPEKYIKELPREKILGIEAPLWSETISTITELEYLAFPRIIGYAELGWSTDENRNWENYKTRLAQQTSYLKRMNVNFYASPLIDWK